jgi:hypothetical protein
MAVDWIYRLEHHINDIFFISTGFRKNIKLNLMSTFFISKFQISFSSEVQASKKNKNAKISSITNRTEHTTTPAAASPAEKPLFTVN